MRRAARVPGGPPPAGEAPAVAVLRRADLVRFVLPLAVTMIVQGLMPQFVAGGVSRGTRPTQTLAAFALAWGLADFLVSPLSQVRQLGLVLVGTRAQAAQVLRFVLLLSAALAGVLALLAWSRMGLVVIRDLHGASPALAEVVRDALLWLVPYPFLEALVRWLSGLLLRARRTEIVSAGMLCGIGVSLITVLTAVATDLVHSQPIALPLLATYAAAATNLVVLGAGCLRFVAPQLAAAPMGDDLGLATLSRFFWPLALIMAIQGMSRPVINLFVSRGPDGEASLAALAVVYSLAHLPYGWLNELRSLPAAFQEHGAGGLRRIRHFARTCGGLSFAIMVGAFWWPPARDLLLLHVLALPPEVAARCHVPLILFSFFPLTVALRAYLHGLALLQRRTPALAPSAPARIGAILLLLVLVPGGLLPGATRGIGALLAGFVIEAIAVWWFVCRRRAQTLPPDVALP